METRLDRVIKGREEYNRLRRKIEELQSLAEKITTLPSQTPVSRSGGNKDALWAQLVDYKEQCEWQLLVYIEDCRALEQELECIRNSDIRTAMKYKYIDARTIEDIAERMSFSTRSIDRFLQTGRKIYLKYYPD